MVMYLARHVASRKTEMALSYVTVNFKIIIYLLLWSAPVSALDVGSNSELFAIDKVWPVVR